VSAEQTTDGAVEATEMERIVADAIENETSPWINQLSPVQALAVARAAMRAMREPTDALLLAARETESNLEAWQAMIDTATAPIQEGATAAVPQEPASRQSP